MQPVLSNGRAAASGMQGHPFDATQCRPGDRLVARIIDITAAGRTVLSLGGVKAMAMQPFGGRAGERVLLEVASRSPQTTSPSNAEAPSTQPRTGRQPPLFEVVVRQNGKTVRLTVLLKIGAGQAPTTDKPPAPLPNGSLSHNPNMLGIIQTGPPERALQMAAAWLNALRHRRVHPNADGSARRVEGYRRAKPTHPFFAGQKEMLEAPETKGAEPPENIGGATCAAGGGKDGLVRFYLKRGAGRSAKDAHRTDIEAVFLLALEHIGRVRTDLRMSGKCLSVGFYVENEDCRQRFAEALPDLERDLSRRGECCRCRVAVSLRKIEALLDEPDGVGAGTAFEARV